MWINLPNLIVSYLGSGLGSIQAPIAMTPSFVDNSSTADISWGPPSNFTKPEAVVIWHGLGDNFNSSGMVHVKNIIQQLMPEIYIHSVAVDENPSLDERRSMMGNANDEVDLVCEKLSKVPQLQRGFGAIGFSQGGLFLRALIERCPNISVSTLVTFGSPHMGVSELPLCADENDWLCKKKNEILKRQVWNVAIQKSIIPAQYFRNLAEYDKYLENSRFLADINNERDETFDTLAKERFGKLEKLVLVKFSKDTTLVPKESAWFQEVDPKEGYIVDMRQTRLYKEDLIGFRRLHKEDRVDFYTIEEDHMRFSDSFLVDIVSKYFMNGL
ncbi:hypothetical protein ACI3L0_001119 [Candidozyma auris]|nr:hypothetical protein B9J08_003136 [[Candida] auris]